MCLIGNCADLKNNAIYIYIYIQEVVLSERNKETG